MPKNAVAGAPATPDTLITAREGRGRRQRMSRVAPPLRSFDFALRLFSMSRLSIICAAIIVWLSTTAVDGANAKGTFRLEGAWRGSFSHNTTHDTTDECLNRAR